MTAKQRKKDYLKKFFQKELKSIVQNLIAYKPEKIIAYGSIVSGNLHDGSDIDILIIKQSNKSPFERIREVFELTQSARIEPLIYTPQEIAEKMSNKDFFLSRIFKESKVLYESK